MGLNAERRPVITIVRPPERPSTPKEQEGVIGPTPQDVEEANAGMIKPNPIFKFIKNHPVITTAGVGIGVGTVAGVGAIAAGLSAKLNSRAEVHQSIAAVPSAVDNNADTAKIPLTFNNNADSNEDPSTFDNKLDKIVVGPNNTVNADQATLDSLPSFDANGKPIFIFDLKLPEGKEIIVTKELHTRFLSQDVVDQAKTEGKRNYVETTKVPIGSKEIAPIDGRVFILSYEKNGSITAPIGVKIEFIGPDGTLWFYNIGVEGIIPSEAAGILNIAVDAPRISPANSNGREWEKGFFVKAGDLLFINNQVVTISRYLEGGKNGDLGRPDDRLPGDIVYHTHSSGKLIGPE